MNGEQSLFDDDEPEVSVVEDRKPSMIAEWQIELLRTALDARGLETMDERQQAIEEAAERPVESLRALTHDDALRVALAARPSVCHQVQCALGLGSEPPRRVRRLSSLRLQLLLGSGGERSERPLPRWV